MCGEWGAVVLLSLSLLVFFSADLLPRVPPFPQASPLTWCPCSRVFLSTGSPVSRSPMRSALGPLVLQELLCDGGAAFFRLFFWLFWSSTDCPWGRRVSWGWEFRALAEGGGCVAVQCKHRDPAHVAALLGFGCCSRPLGFGCLWHRGRRAEIRSAG